MHEPPPGMRAAQLKAAWRTYGEDLANRGTALRIGVAATFTANSLVPFLGAPLLEAGLAPAIEVGPYNQLFQVCLDYQTAFHAEPYAIILLFRIEDLMLDELLAFLHGDSTASDRAMGKIDLLATAVQGLRGRFSGTIFVNLPAFPATLPAHALGLENPLGLGQLHRALVSRFAEMAGAIPGVRLCDFDAVQRECGLNCSFDSRQWYLYRQPFTDTFLLEAGALLARMIVAVRRAPKKCVVLDCDNTLWGGVIGEDGLSGIELGDEFPGTAYRDFQRLLLYWRQQGVLLALASKNNEAEVWEVFDKQPGMILRREHLSAWQINWKPKGETIAQVTQALNIGLDSLVFIDDSPMEIESMRAMRPEVTSILLPEDPADILEAMRNLPLFDRLEVTDEDRARAERMRTEQQRKTLEGSLGREEFLQTLELRLDFFPAQEIDLERIAQLIQKTNQFNLSSIRRSVDEVRLLARSPRHRVYGLRVSDKFGDYGLTGVAVVEIDENRREWFLDTFLLSCRVLGRGVETALLAAVAEKARAEGASDLVATFIPTAKNAPAATFLADHHFAPTDGQRWRISLSQVPAPSPFISFR